MAYQQATYPPPPQPVYAQHQQQAGAYPPAGSVYQQPQQQGQPQPPQYGNPSTNQPAGCPPTHQQPLQHGQGPPQPPQYSHPSSNQSVGIPPSQSGQPWQPGMNDDQPMDNIPSAPPEDNPNVQEEAYHPQSTEGLKPIQGYGQVGFESGGYVPPPPPSSPPPAYAEAPRMEFRAEGHITDEQAKTALLQKVKEHCCWRAGAAKQMKFNDLQSSDALHYKLETFCEGRKTALKEVPFPGGVVDGPEMGPAPLPWSIPCGPSNGQFIDQKHQLPVPHTDTIRTCGSCFGRGWKRCYRCHGFRRVRCIICRGDGHHTHYEDGHHHRRTCHHCHGSGHQTCGTCHGNGRITCQYCKGFRLVKTYIQLTVTFTNHVSDFIHEETDLPDELVKTVNGVVLFSQTLPQVWPVVSFPVRLVNDNSQRLVESHKTAWPMERQLQQRQTLRAVPVTELSANWKDKNFRFWVYGKERKVYAPEYPQQCCCTIL